MNSQKATILVLGGGIGGLVASGLMKEKLKDKASVSLIDKKKFFQFPPSYPWLMLGLRKPEQVQKELSLLKKKHGIEFLNEQVVSIDSENKQVKTNSSTMSYDFLVIALGAEYAPETIPGFSEYAHHIYDLESAIKFRKAVENFSGGRIAIGVSRIPFKCPAAPYEAALLLDDYFTKKSIRNKVHFEFFTPEAMPVPSVGPEVGAKVLELLKSRGINYHPKLKLTGVKQGELSFEGGETIGFDLLFCVPPHRAPRPVSEAGLVDQTGWVAINPRTFETNHKGVYAVGDVTSVPTPNGYVPFLPKAGVFAHGQAEVVANNISAEVKGKGRMKEWNGHGSCFLEVGGGQSAFVKGQFFAEPKPQIDFRSPGRVWHAQKVVFEKYWMYHWF